MGNDKNVRYRVPNVNQCKECHATEDESRNWAKS